MLEYITFEKKVTFLGVGIQPVLLDDKPVLPPFFIIIFFFYIIKADLLNLKM